MAKKGLASDKNKIILLVVLSVAMIGIFVYNMFFTGPAPRQTSQANSNTGPRTVQTKQAAPLARVPDSLAVPAPQQIATEIDLTDSSPLNLAAARPASDGVHIDSRGNIFAYYVPPPPKPEPPPPPPPITLHSATPSTTVVAGIPRPFTLTVSGASIPEDAQIYIDGSPRQTKRVSANQLSTEIRPQEYASPRTISIEVKSPADPQKWYSNPLNLNVAPAPEPPFKYVGRIGDKALFEVTGSKEYFRLQRGATMQSVWRIDNFDDKAVEMTHLQFEIKKRLPMQEKTR